MCIHYSAENFIRKPLNILMNLTKTKCKARKKMFKINCGTKKNYENMCLNINMHTYINTVDKIFLKHYLLYRVRQIPVFGKCFKKNY